MVVLRLLMLSAMIMAPGLALVHHFTTPIRTHPSACPTRVEDWRICLAAIWDDEADLGQE